MLPTLFHFTRFPVSFRLGRMVAAGSFLALPGLTLAQGQPTMENPSRGTGSGIIQTIQNYGYDMVMLVALLASLCPWLETQTLTSVEVPTILTAGAPHAWQLAATTIQLYVHSTHHARRC